VRVARLPRLDADDLVTDRASSGCALDALTLHAGRTFLVALASGVTLASAASHVVTSVFSEASAGCAQPMVENTEGLYRGWHSLFFCYSRDWKVPQVLL